MIQTTEHGALAAPFRRSSERTEAPIIRLHTPVSLLVHVELMVGGRGRSSHQPELALTGNLHLPELVAEMAFRNRSEERHRSGSAGEHRTNVVLVPHRSTMTIPLQDFVLSARGGTDVWALTAASDPSLPWMEHYAGRLGDEPLRFDRYLPVGGILDVTFTPEGFKGGRGTNVDVRGELRFDESMHLRLLFRDPAKSSTPALESENGDVLMIAAGARLPIRRLSVSTLAGRNPWMTVRVIEADARVCSRAPVMKPRVRP